MVLKTTRLGPQNIGLEKCASGPEILAIASQNMQPFLEHPAPEPTVLKLR